MDLEMNFPKNDPITMERLFPDELIEKVFVKVDYIISFLGATYKNEMSAYCLARVIGDEMEILLSKQSMDKDNLREEAENLAKYFNAKFL